MARIRRGCTTGEGNSQPGRWKVGKYIRLSRDDGSGESESIANQRKILDEQIPGYFDGGWDIVDEYIDDGRTGTSDDTRPAFLRLAEDVRRGRVNCIVTKNLSRAFRNSANQGRFLEEFIPLYNTRFISLYEPHIDTFLNPEVVHSLEVSITGFINEQYAYKTSVDVRRTFETKRKKGEFIGAFAPYGLMKRPEDKNRLMIDEPAAQVVRDIFRWFADEGMSKSGIAKRLNGLGIPNPAAYKARQGLKYRNPQGGGNDGLWSEKTVCAILLNEMYLGNMVQGKQKVVSYKVHDRVAIAPQDWCVVPNTHEAIVDGETFAKAQALHRRDTRVPPGQASLSLFSGFLRCGDCKKSMTRKAAKGVAYYCCSTYSRKSKTACTRHTIREDVLEQAVLLALQTQIARIPALPDLVEEIRAAPVHRPQLSRMDRLLGERERERKKLIAAADSLYPDWRAGELTEEEYRRIKAGLEERRKRLEEGIANLKEEREALAAGERAGEPYLADFLQNQTISRLERGLLAELVDAIYVHEGGSLTIQLNAAAPAGAGRTGQAAADKITDLHGKEDDIP